VVRWQLLLGLCFCAVLGCSSSSALKSEPTVDAGADPRAAVLASCVSFAMRSCEASRDCCTNTYGSYDADGCVATFETQVCEPAADAVEAGVATYDESAVEACLAAHTQADAICTPDWDQNLEIRKAIWSACKVVRGTTPPGKSCTTSVTCAEPDGAKTANCIAGSCRVLEVLVEGAACPFQSGAVSTCDSGLYCTAEEDSTGVCMPALAEGAACSGILGDPACGLGNYCDVDEKVCKRAVNVGGPSCKQGFECVSFDCDRVTSTCEPALAVVTEEQCLGASGM
jgi:hypothetical protein